MVDSKFKYIGIKQAIKEAPLQDSAFVYFHMNLTFGDTFEELNKKVKYFGTSYHDIPNYEVKSSEAFKVDNGTIMKLDGGKSIEFDEGTLFAIKITYPMLSTRVDMTQVLKELGEAFYLFINQIVKDLKLENS